MLIPKIFRWLFFRKKLVRNTFDALRNDSTVYLDTGISLDTEDSKFPGSQKFDSKNLPEFKQQYPLETVIVLFGNNRTRLNEVHNLLENHGYTHVFNAGATEDLIKTKKQLNEKL